MYDLASFKYIFVECFSYVLVLLLLEFVSLRTVPTIVTAHTFYASRDSRVSYG